MSHAMQEPTNAPDALRGLYAPVRAELDEVDELLRAELHSRHTFVEQLARHGFRLGGKRMRPALVLLSARACGNLTRDHLVLAAAVELIHTATLIHDDVLDEATLRRHLATVNARWDNEASVLMGDYLFSRAICLAASIEGGFACRAIGRAGWTMCEGELRQVANRGNFGLTEAEYLDIIADKTAALTSCCCRLGGHYAGADPDTVEALAGYGRQLGIAFQIADDLLDVLGEERAAGKSLGTDLLKQKPTMPLIRLLGQANDENRATVLELLTASDNHRREALRPWLERFGAVSYARKRALERAQAARDELTVLRDSPARKALVGLTEFVVNRQQ